jgi:lipopolysaccharide assembly protein A
MRSVLSYLMWILRIALFVLVLAFAVKNTDPVTVHYYFGGQWQSPLIFVLLVVFCAGIALGLAAALGPLYRQRREISEMKRRLRDLPPRESGTESGTGSGLTKAGDGRRDGN